MEKYPIYTEINNCRDCYRCVRHCPVKAIQIKDAHAEIIYERCTFCGTCVNECPNSVKVIRNDTDKVRMAFLSNRKVIVSLAPSYVSEFIGYEENFVRSLYKLGFHAVSETAIGAALVSQALDIYMEEHGDAPFISTACPSVVQLVRKYFPEDINALAPVPSPLQTHSAYLRKLYGNDIVIVFIGPCVAKKIEADEHPGYPDISLTFREVREWLEEENIDLANIDTGIPVDFVPSKAGKAAIYPIENGQIETSKIWEGHFVEQSALSVSGITRVMSSLQGTHTSDFLEALNCDGGCISGPGTSHQDSAVRRKKAVTSYVLERLNDADVSVNIGKDEIKKLRLDYLYMKYIRNQINHASESSTYSDEYKNAFSSLAPELYKFPKDDNFSADSIRSFLSSSVKEIERIINNK